MASFTFTIENNADYQVNKSFNLVVKTGVVLVIIPKPTRG